MYQPFRSTSLKVINFHDRISLWDYSLWEEAYFPLWFWSYGLDFILFISSLNQLIYYPLVSLTFLIKQLLLNCDYLFLSRDYLFTLTKISKYFILSCYYHICLSQPIWNSSACHKCASSRWGIVCTQVGPNWVAAGPVSTPILRILGPNTAGGSLADFNQKRPITLNWQHRWRVEKQKGTEALANKCLQSPEQREIWVSCPHKQSPGQRHLTNSSLTWWKVTTEWGLNPNHSQESLLTMPTSSLKFCSPCNTHSNK